MRVPLVTPRTRLIQRRCNFSFSHLCERAPSLGNHINRTTQIRRKDLQLWCKLPAGIMDQIVPPAALACLLQADAMTMTLDNQKNGQRDAALHHEVLPNNLLCLCRAAACRLVSTQLCDLHSANAILSPLAPQKRVSGTQMAGGISVAALQSMIWLQGHI